MLLTSLDDPLCRQEELSRQLHPLIFVESRRSANPFRTHHVMGARSKGGLTTGRRPSCRDQRQI